MYSFAKHYNKYVVWIKLTMTTTAMAVPVLQCSRSPNVGANREIIYDTSIEIELCVCVSVPERKRRVISKRILLGKLAANHYKQMKESGKIERKCE